VGIFIGRFENLDNKCLSIDVLMEWLVNILQVSDCIDVLMNCCY
jgi:hypothetical protein